MQYLEITTIDDCPGSSNLEASLVYYRSAITNSYMEQKKDALLISEFV